MTTAKAILAGVTMVLAALAAALAGAQDLDFSKIKCSDFLNVPKDQIGVILTWLEGFYTKEDAPPIMYADKRVKDAKGLSNYCNARRDDDIIKGAEAVMPAK